MKNILFNILFAILTLLIVSFFYKKIMFVTIIVGLISFIGLIKWKSKLTLFIFILTGIFGVLAESFAIWNGVWKYSFFNFQNIPLWLFFVWGNTGAFIYQTSLELKKLGVRK